MDPSLAILMPTGLIHTFVSTSVRICPHTISDYPCNRILLVLCLLLLPNPLSSDGDDESLMACAFLQSQLRETLRSDCIELPCD